MALWALEWRSDNRIDGKRCHIMFNFGLPLLFTSREQARKYRDEHFGYIRDRAELRADPHGWKLPRAVRVEVARIEAAA